MGFDRGKDSSCEDGGALWEEELFFASALGENLLKLLHQNPEQIAEYQDFLLEFFPKIYLNPQYNAFEPAYPAELLPFIQWALDKTQLQLRSKLQLRTRLKRLIGRA